MILIMSPSSSGKRPLIGDVGDNVPGYNYLYVSINSAFIRQTFHHGSDNIRGASCGARPKHCLLNKYKIKN